MSAVVIIWSVIAGFVLGIIAECWARKLPQPPHTLHESCHERYQQMRTALLREIRDQADEIDRLRAVR
jgi:hypothetical protein